MVRSKAGVGSVLPIGRRQVRSARPGYASRGPAKAVSRRQVAWACALGLIGTASIAVPAHRSFSLPQGRPLIASPLTPTQVDSFVAPVSTRVVTLPTVIQTPDGAVRCVVVPSAADATRVDCELLASTGVVTAAGNDICGERWGATVRLSGTARLTCSAPLPDSTGLVLQGRDMVRTGDVSCANGPVGMQCVNVSTGVGFSIQRNGIRLVNEAQGVA